MEALAHLDKWAVWLTAVVAGLGALGWMLRKSIRAGRSIATAVRKIDKLEELASYELQHNGGGSIKDAASMVPQMRMQLAAHITAAEKTHRDADARMDRFERAHVELVEAVTSLAQTLPQALRATPARNDRE